MKYKNVWIPASCPNGCFERLIDQGLSGNKIDGVEPRMYSYNIGRTTFEIKRWSKRLKRYSHRAQGHYIALNWTHCPFCGKELIKEAADDE